MATLRRRGQAASLARRNGRLASLGGGRLAQLAGGLDVARSPVVCAPPRVAAAFRTKRGTPTQRRPRAKRAYSHSIVDGGFDEMS